MNQFCTCCIEISRLLS